MCLSKTYFKYLNIKVSIIFCFVFYYFPKMSNNFFSIFTTRGEKNIICYATYTLKTFSVALIIARLNKIENVITVIQTFPALIKIQCKLLLSLFGIKHIWPVKLLFCTVN